MIRSRHRWIAPAIDLACFMIFVAIGRENHGINSGLTWYLTVLWPFVAGWFAVALATRLYVAPSRPWLRLAITWAVGLALGLLLRAVVTQREALSTFTIVVYTFVALEVFGWRAVAALISRGRTLTARRRALSNR